MNREPKIICHEQPTGLAWRPVTDQEFLRRLRRYARKRGLQVHYRPDRGKGSHAEVGLGNRRVTLPRGEMKPGTLRSILRDLDIEKQGF